MPKELQILFIYASRELGNVCGNGPKDVRIRRMGFLQLVTLFLWVHFPASLYLMCYLVQLNVALPVFLVGWLSMELNGGLCLRRLRRLRFKNVPGIM